MRGEEKSSSRKGERGEWRGGDEKSTEEIKKIGEEKRGEEDNVGREEQMSNNKI